MSSWPQTIPAFVVFIALAFVPGWLLVRAFGARGVEAVAISPAVSVGVLAGFGTLTWRLGLHWTWPVVIGSIATSVAAAWVIGALVRRGRRRRDPALGVRRRVFGHPRADIVMACLIGVVIALVTMLPAIGRPDELVDSPDAVYHLNRLRTFLTTGDFSLFNPTFYPNGLHAWVGTGLMALPGVPVVAGTNVATLVLAAVVWPVGCVALVRHVLGRSLLVTYAAGFASAAFLAFPTMLLGWGVLWPNLMGTAMTPAALALMLQAARRRTPGTVLTFAAAVPGLALIQPNAVIALAVFAIAWFVTAQVRAGLLGHRPRRAVVRDLVLAGAVIAAGLAAAPYLSARIASTQSYAWPTRDSIWTALVQVVGGKMMVYTVLWGLLALLALGLVWIFTKARSAIPIVSMWLACVVLYVVAASSTWGWTDLLTGYWYNDKFRLASLAAVPGVVIVAAAAPRLRLWLMQVPAVRHRPLLAAGLALALLPALTLVLHSSTRYRLLHDFFTPRHPYQVIADHQQQASMAALAERIPAGQGLVGRPENGSPLMWALFGTNTLYRSIPIPATGDEHLIGTGFAQLSTRPDVCAALARHDIRWAIDSTHTYWLDRPELTSGLFHLGKAPGLEKVETVGQYTLYRITGCGLA
jgi:hypothetical protein